MKSTRFWEAVNASVWPAFDQVLYDGWLLRFTHGYSRNSSSVWPLYAGELPMEAKIAFCEAQYEARGLTPGFRLSEIPGHGAIEEALLERGYARDNPNLVMVRSSTESEVVDIQLLERDEWLETAFCIHPVDDPDLVDWERKLLAKISLPSCYAIVTHEGKAAGYGRTVLLGEIVNIESLWTMPGLRGRGLGSQLVRGLLQRGREDGAKSAYLTVNQPNTEAQRFYARLGFETRYTYRYLVPADEVD
jgi:ribosomal protein S18 acetylase RimI-like enzyme